MLGAFDEEGAGTEMKAAGSWYVRKAPREGLQGGAGAGAEGRDVGGYCKDGCLTVYEAGGGRALVEPGWEEVRSK